jgi:tetratricopeptide (TPR) repeat protein
MTEAIHRIRALAPLALGAALASHAGADAKTEEFGKVRMTGPDPVAGATAEAARQQGRALLAANKPVEALQAFRQALAQDPDSIESLNGVAVAYDRLGRYEESRLHYEAALGIDPTSPMLLANYGLSLYLQGDKAEAVRFLQLAASAGDPDVQAASLRTLARIEREAPRPGPRSIFSSPAAAAPAQDVSGPSIVRTSDHEVRLVLESPKARAAVQMAAAVVPSEAALVIAPVGELTPREEARIFAREASTIAAEQTAVAQAAATAAAAGQDIPAEMQVAALLEKARAGARRQPTPGTPDFPLGQREVQSFGRSPTEQDWYRDQILVMAPAAGQQGRRQTDRDALRMAFLAVGLAPPRRTDREALAAKAAAALAADAAPRRSFERPFESDNGRLNDLAARIHGATAEPDILEQVAILEALIARVRSA